MSGHNNRNRDHRQYRYINITHIKPSMIEQMRVMPMYVPCPSCGGLGYHATQERQTVEIGGVPFERIMLTARQCPDCLPWLPGLTYGLCAC